VQIGVCAYLLTEFGKKDSFLKGLLTKTILRLGFSTGGVGGKSISTGHCYFYTFVTK
jgi:hypothetical protein